MKSVRKVFKKQGELARQARQNRSQARRERDIAKRTRMKIVQKANHPGLDLRVESGRCRAEFHGP